MKIDIFLEDVNDVFHPFSKTTLNPELASYIIDECKGVKKNTPIEFEISSNKVLDERDKEVIESLIKNHFMYEIDEENIKNHKSFFVYLWLMIIGSIFILISNMISETLLKEILNIIGWLSIWELVYDILFIESKDLIVIHRYREIIKAKMIFKNNH